MVGYALEPPTDPSHFELLGLENDMVSLEGDVRDLDHLIGVVEAHQPEVVFHLAAQAIVRTGYEDPRETYEVNVMGTVNVLEAIRHSDSVRAVVAVTSDKCYENREWLWPYRESEPLGGRDPYSSSKAASELVVRSYRDSFLASPGEGQPVQVASARAGNVIGGGDWADYRLLTDIVHALLSGEPLAIRFPEATRPWQHVLDPLHGYLLLAERLLTDGADYAEPWNFGPADQQQALPVGEIVERMKALWQSELTVEMAPGPHFHEHTYLRLDPSKARAHLNWAPLLTTEQALEWIVEWYKAYEAGANLRQVSERQLERFRQLCTTSQD